MQVAELYSNSIKGQPVVAETTAAAAAPAPAPMPTVQSLSGQTISNSLRSVGTLGRIVDARFVHANAGGNNNSGGLHGLGVALGGSGSSGADSGSRLRKFRRASPTREYEQYGRSYSDAAEYASSNQWEGFQQENGGSAWVRDGAAHVDSPGSERIVVYSSPSSGNTNYGSSYYSGGHAPWTYAPPGGLPLPPPPQQQSPSVASTALPAGSGYTGRYISDADGGAGIPSSRQYDYGAYRSRSSDRPTNAKVRRGLTRYSLVPHRFLTNPRVGSAHSRHRGVTGRTRASERASEDEAGGSRRSVQIDRRNGAERHETREAVTWNEAVEYHTASVFIGGEAEGSGRNAKDVIVE